MGKRIVIAEDDPITRMDIYEILDGAGYEVVGQATNGMDAVELCRKYKPNLILMDIKMPYLDGLKAGELILRENLVDAVVLLTSYSDEEFIEQAKDVGVFGYIVKPIDERRLLPQVEIAIAKGKEIRKMREEIEKRRAINIAKKILMKRQGISEDMAYRQMRSESMNNRCSIYQIAISIIEEDK